MAKKKKPADDNGRRFVRITGSNVGAGHEGHVFDVYGKTDDEVHKEVWDYIAEHVDFGWEFTEEEE